MIYYFEIINKSIHDVWYQLILYSYLMGVQVIDQTIFLRYWERPTWWNASNCIMSEGKLFCFQVILVSRLYMWSYVIKIGTKNYLINKYLFYCFIYFARGTIGINFKIVIMIGWKNSLKIPKGVIRSCKSKDRQYNGQKKKEERTNNDLQNITESVKHRRYEIFNSSVLIF